MAVENLNILPNGDFEETKNSEYPEGWYNYTTSGTITFFHHRGEDTEDSTYSVKVPSGDRLLYAKNDTTAWQGGWNLIAKIKAYPSVEYEFSAFIRTNFTSDSDYAYVIVKEYDDAGTLLATNAGTKVYGEQDWTKTNDTFTTNASTTKIDVFLEGVSTNDSGKCWFDCAYLDRSAVAYVTATNIQTMTGLTSTQYSSTDHTSLGNFPFLKLEKDTGRRWYAEDIEYEQIQQACAWLCAGLNEQRKLNAVADEDDTSDYGPSNTYLSHYWELIRVLVPLRIHMGTIKGAK